MFVRRNLSPAKTSEDILHSLTLKVARIGDRDE
jgi:hypothetical protein